MNKCQFIKPDSTQCEAKPIKGDTFCFFHSEKTKTQRQEAVKKGGDSLKRSYGRDDEIKLNCVDDVFILLQQTANDLRQNKINNKTAAILNFIAGTTLKAIEAKYVEKTRENAFRKTYTDIEMENLLYPPDDTLEDEE
jgi:hypothetical protein